MRPPFPYFGGKGRLAQRLVELMPSHEHYVEPFAGSLAVLMAKPRVAHETVNDLDGDLVNFWRVLRERPEDLARVCALTPHAREEHTAARDVTAGDDLERARRLWTRLCQGRGGVRSAGWRHYQDPAGSSSAMPDYLAGYVRRIAPAAERLVGVTLECRPALDIVQDFGRHERVLLYVDPPYLASTRSSGVYAVEMGDDAAHRDLAAALAECRAAVVLSGYPSPLYDDLYASWHRLDIPTATGQGGSWEARTEVVWSNRPLAEPDLFSDLIEATAAPP